MNNDYSYSNNSFDDLGNFYSNVNIKINGDNTIASKYLGFAKKELNRMMNFSSGNKNSFQGAYNQKFYNFEDARLRIRYIGKQKHIEITTFFCPLLNHGLIKDFVSDDTSLSSYQAFGSGNWSSLPGYNISVDSFLSTTNALNEFKTQYEDIKSTCYTGMMKYVMQNSQGNTMQNKMNFAWLDTDGIVFPYLENLAFREKFDKSIGLNVKICNEGLFVRDANLCTIKSSFDIFNDNLQIAKNSYFNNLSFSLSGNSNDNLVNESGVLQILTKEDLSDFYNENTLPLFKSQGWLFRENHDSTSTNYPGGDLQVGHYVDFYYSLWNTKLTIVDSITYSSLYCIRLIVRYIVEMEDGSLIVKRLAGATKHIVKEGIPNLNSCNLLFNTNSFNFQSDLFIPDDSSLSGENIIHTPQLNNIDLTPQSADCPIYIIEERANYLSNPVLRLVISAPVFYGSTPSLNTIDYNIFSENEILETATLPGEPVLENVNIRRSFFLSSMNDTTISILNDFAQFVITVFPVNGGFLTKRTQEIDRPFYYDEMGNQNPNTSEASIVEPGVTYTSVQLELVRGFKKVIIPRYNRNFFFLIMKRVYEHYPGGISHSLLGTTYFNYKMRNGVLQSTRHGLNGGYQNAIEQKIKVIQESYPGVGLFNANAGTSIMDNRGVNNIYSVTLEADMSSMQTTDDILNKSILTNMQYINIDGEVFVSQKLRDTYNDLLSANNKVTFIGRQEDYNS